MAPQVPIPDLKAAHDPAVPRGGECHRPRARPVRRTDRHELPCAGRRVEGSSRSRDVEGVPHRRRRGRPGDRRSRGHRLRPDHRGRGRQGRRPDAVPGAEDRGTAPGPVDRLGARARRRAVLLRRPVGVLADVRPQLGHRPPRRPTRCRATTSTSTTPSSTPTTRPTATSRTSAREPARPERAGTPTISVPGT